MDKSDIYWCLSPEGMASLASNHPGMISSPIENFIAGLIVNKLVAIAKKKECQECIQYVLDHKNAKEKLEIVLFDLLMREYVWHMGEVCYKQSKNIVQGIRGMYALFRLFRGGSESSLNNWAEKYNKAFVNVYKIIDNFSYVILTNLFEPYNIISEAEYKWLSNKYVVDSHVKFEILKAPHGHQYENERFIDIILNKERKETTAYYKLQYGDYTFLSGGFKGDYPKYFFDKLPDTIFGNEDIYKL